jgi:hypothetical protein|tara:strand:+ start:428 stop:742 length:315 start_codon:yes stop_codon:yes gene_type:complete
MTAKRRCLVWLVSAITALFVLIPAAAAREGCAPFAAADHSLRKTHGENPVFIGVTRAGDFLTIYLNAENGTWTAMAVRPQGKMACALDAGTSGHVRGAKSGERS